MSRHTRVTEVQSKCVQLATAVAAVHSVKACKANKHTVQLAMLVARFCSISLTYHTKSSAGDPTLEVLTICITPEPHSPALESGCIMEVQLWCCNNHQERHSSAKQSGIPSTTDYAECV